MKKSTALFFGLSLVASTLMAKGLTIKDISSMQFFKNNNLEIAQVNQLNNNIYEVIGVSADAEGNVQAGKFLVPSDKSTVITGQSISVLDGKTGSFLKVNPNVKEMVKNEAFKFGNGPKEVMIFTDPECPYCKSLEKALDGMKDKITAHVFFYPLSFHKNATTYVDYVLSKPVNERYEALLETSEASFAKKEYKNSHKSINVVKKHMAYGAVLGVAGTPSVFTMDGKPVDLQSFMNDNVKKVAKNSVDTEGLKFLIENNSMLTLNEGTGKPNLYIFAETDSKDCQKLLNKTNIEKLTEKYTVNVQLVPTQEHPDSFAEAVFIMIGKDKKEQLERFNTMLADGKLSKEEREALDKLVAEKDKTLSETVIKVGSLPQIMKQMGAEKIPLIVNESGKIIKDSEL